MCLRPDVGYVQGMSYLAAMLCLHCDSAYLAFRCLANLLARWHLHDFYMMRPERINTYFAIFDAWLEDKAKPVHAQLRKHEISHDCYLFNWLQVRATRGRA